MNSIYSKLQAHTIRIYDLNHQEYTVVTIPARELLCTQRFDLFAKLFYINNISQNPELATKVYSEHIKAFNPDFKEPGRDDKNGCSDFINDFNAIIRQFKNNEFDDSISIVPVDKNGIILDGSHRLAALAYYNRTITIARFHNVTAKCRFDYDYFLNRGLSRTTADIIANEMANWLNNAFIACLWPRMGNKHKKGIAINYLIQNFEVGYIGECHINLKSLKNFIALIYSNQEWVNNPLSVTDKALNCYGSSNSTLGFVLFTSPLSSKQIVKHKEELRQLFKSDKHSIHITDNQTETLEITHLAFTKEGRDKWLSVNKYYSLAPKISEKWLYFKKVSLIRFKSYIYKLIFQ